jgi:long-chain fatty acid transport protein
VTAAIALALLLAPSTAEAAGFYQSDIGTRGMSRAGAFVAGVNDLSAQYYNPAALARLRPMTYLNFTGAWQGVDFTRIDYDGAGQQLEKYPTVNNNAGPMPIPAFGVSHNFGIKNFSAALGLFSPFAPRMEYPQEGAQRYTLKESLLIQFYAGPSVAYKIGWLSVGAGVYYSYVSADYGLDIMVCSKLPESEGCEGSPDDPNGDGGQYENNDVGTLLKMKDAWNLTWNVGLLAEPTDFMRIGFSLQPPLRVEGKGSLQTDFGTEQDPHWLVEQGYIDGTRHKDNNVTVLVNMPLLIRQGIEFYGDRWAVEGTAVYQRWRISEEIRVTDVDIALPEGDTLAGFNQFLDPPVELAITDDVVLPQNYVDTWSWRLGGQYRIADPVMLRTGILYEGSAVPSNTQGVDLVDGKKLGWGFGGTIHVNENVAIDVGGMRTWLQDRSITESDVHRKEIPVDLAAAVSGDLDVALQEGRSVGTGEFQSRTLFLSTGVVWKFGRRVGEDAPKGKAKKKAKG